MQSPTISLKPLHKGFYKLLVLISLLFGLLLINTTFSHAQSLQDCPPGVKELYDNSAKDPNRMQGTYIVGYEIDANGQQKPIYITCGNAQTVWEKLLTRVVVFITSIIGLVFTFSVGKSALMMMMAGENKDAFQQAVGGLKTSIFAVVGTLIAYQLIVFILTGVVGVGGTNNNGYNIICGNQLVFQLVFSKDDGTPIVPSACQTK